MKQFSRQDIARRDLIMDDLNAAVAGIDEVWPALEEAIQAVNVKIDAYNEALGAARGFTEDMVSAIDAYMSEKSEKWLDGEAGQSFTEWKSGIESESLDDLEHIEVPDKPEPDDAATLEGLATEPS